MIIHRFQIAFQINHNSSYTFSIECLHAISFYIGAYNKAKQAILNFGDDISKISHCLRAIHVEFIPNNHVIIILPTKGIFLQIKFQTIITFDSSSEGIHHFGTYPRNINIGLYSKPNKSSYQIVHTYHNISVGL